MITHIELDTFPYWVADAVSSSSIDCILPPPLDMIEGLARYTRAGRKGERFLPAHRLALMLDTGAKFKQVDYLNCAQLCSTIGCINPKHWCWGVPASLNLRVGSNRNAGKAMQQGPVLETKLTMVELKYIRKAEKLKQLIASPNWEEIL